MFFFSVSLINKFKMAVVGGVAIAVLMVATPTVLRQRFATILSRGDATDRLTESAMASTSQRTELLKRSILLTLQHPLFGVGPGNFQPASAVAFGNDLGGSWYETHNAMTQISSEQGIPGLILFLSVLTCSFRAAWRVFKWKPARGQVVTPAIAAHIEFLNSMGFCLVLSLTTLTITSLFSSIAYQFFFPTLIGFCAALELTTNEELSMLFPPPATLARPFNPGSQPAPNTPGRLRPAT
jgi:O-antigen ligase